MDQIASNGWKKFFKRRHARTKLYEQLMKIMDNVDVK